jgi:hypothetical protein
MDEADDLVVRLISTSLSVVEVGTCFGYSYIFEIWTHFTPVLPQKFPNGVLKPKLASLARSAALYCGIVQPQIIRERA